MDYKLLRQKKQELKTWQDDYSFIKRKYDDNKRLEETIDKKRKDVEQRINYWENISKPENFFTEHPVKKFLKLGFQTHIIGFIYITKDKGFRIFIKKVKNGVVTHNNTEYFVYTERLIKGKSYFYGVWLEDKLEQLDIKYLDKTPISSKNLKDIFNKKIVSIVFNPQEKDDNRIFDLLTNPIFLAMFVGGILVLLHILGVIDIIEIVTNISTWITGATG